MLDEFSTNYPSPDMWTGTEKDTPYAAMKEHIVRYQVRWLARCLVPNVLCTSVAWVDVGCVRLSKCAFLQALRESVVGRVPRLAPLAHTLHTTVTFTEPGRGRLNPENLQRAG
jgi:hypothetical protein